MSNDIIRDTTVAFLRSEEHFKVALEVERALEFLRKEVSRDVLRGIESQLRRRLDQEGLDWEPDLVGNMDHLLGPWKARLILRSTREGHWAKRRETSSWSGVWLLTEEQNWSRVVLGVQHFPDDARGRLEASFNDWRSAEDTKKRRDWLQRLLPEEHANWNTPAFSAKTKDQLDAVSKDIAEKMLAVVRADSDDAA